MNIENIIEDYKDHLMDRLGIHGDSQMGEMIEEATWEFMNELDDLDDEDEFLSVGL